jgi:GMP synthase-like glutamine amidotransferase
MNNDLDEKIADKYKNFKKVVCVLYSMTVFDKLNLLLVKRPGEIFEFISAEISKMDNAATIAIARHMTANLFGLFSKKNFEKIQNKINLELNDLIWQESNNFKESIPWYRLFDFEFFQEWIEKFERNIIQYDHLEDTILYFIEIPFLNTYLLSENLDRIDYPYTFEYFEYDFKELNNLKSEEGNKNNEIFFQNKIDSESLKLMKLFDFESHVKNTSQNEIYILLTCLNYPISTFKGSFLLNSLFSGLYRRNNEQWLFYSAFDSEFPSDEILKSKNCKAVIIPGSASHVYDYDPPTVETIQFIKEFMRNSDYSHVKFLGICYGHQLFNQAINGKVNKAEKRIHYIEKIECPKISELKLKDNSGEEINLTNYESFNIYQVHGDEVASYPDFMINYGQSQSCRNELLISFDYRVLTIQGHPEYNPDFFLFKLHKYISWKDFEKESKEFIKSKQVKNGDGDNILKSRDLFYYFLKHKYIKQN